MSQCLVRAAFCALLALPSVSIADRLPIEVLPVEITVRGAPDLRPRAGAVEKAFADIRKGLHILGVRPDEYDLTLAETSAEPIDCPPADPMQRKGQLCWHPTVGTLDADGLNEFSKKLILDLGNYRYLPRGTVLVFVLLEPDGFVWDGAYYGVASSWYWDSRDRSRWHWTNVSCAAWALNQTRVLAHEIGHCFGLYHNVGDPLSGGDNTLDLMGIGAPMRVNWLRGSNARQVRHHFRQLSRFELRMELPAMPEGLMTVPQTAGVDKWLLSSAHRCDAVGVSRWLDAGASPNARDEKGDTALHLISYGIAKGDANETSFGASTEPKDWDACGRIAGRLVRAGAVPNVWNDRGETPLMVAAGDRSLPALEALIYAGAFVNARDKRDGQTALHKATLLDSAAAIALLVKARARLNVQDSGGNTALHVAALFNRPRAGISLVQHGARKDIRNNAGESALQVAIMWEHEEIVFMIGGH